MKVKDIMTAKQDLIALEPHMKVMEAADLMVKEKIGSIIVVENNIPVGIVTEKDIIRLIRQHKELGELVLADIMTHPLITIMDNQDVTTAAEMMYRNRIHHLVVLHSELGTLEGIVSSFDILKEIHCHQELRDLFMQMPSCYQRG